MHLPYPNRNMKDILQKSFKWRISGSLDWSYLAQLWAWKIIKAGALGFPGGLVVKNPPANIGDIGSMCDLVRSHML